MADQETRLTAAEENIQGILRIQNRGISSFYSKLILGIGKKVKESCVHLGLQMTDVEIDERVTALEEGGGGSSPQNGRQNCVLKYQQEETRIMFRNKTSFFETHKVGIFGIFV